jgi:hypothetical protein
MPSEKATMILQSKTDMAKEKIAELTDVEAWNLIYSIRSTKAKDNRLQVCFTGFGASKKIELTNLAYDKKINVVSSVTKKLDFLCGGETAGPMKLEKAIEQGVQVLSENEFMNLIETGEVPNQTSQGVKTDDPTLSVLEKLGGPQGAWHEGLCQCTGWQVETFDDGHASHESREVMGESVAKERRSKKTIANFVKFCLEDPWECPYLVAAGWYMAVIEPFRDQLDIMQTEVIERNPVRSNLSDEDFLSQLKQDPNVRQIVRLETNKRGEARWKTWRWTQGQNYCLTRGHTIYDSPLAYGDWFEYLKIAERAFQIDEATPANPVDGDAGRVSFVEYRPNSDRTALVPKGMAVLTQIDFVNLLRDGNIIYNLNPGYTSYDRYVGGDVV